MGLRPALYITKKGTLDSQLQVIKFTNCLPMVLSGFSPGTPASSTTKTGCHDIHVAEILLKVALNTKNQSINHISYVHPNHLIFKLSLSL